MRPLLLASALLVVPALAQADPQCAMPPGPWQGRADGIQVAAQSGTSTATPLQPVPLPTAIAVAPVVPAALSYLRAAGNQLTELPTAHGLRRVVARNGAPFTFFNVVPDGSAVVAGLISELTPAELLAAAGSQARELGMAHGLRTIFVDIGPQYQVFYVTPDGERVIPGGMWDASGRNVTAAQVKPIEGAIATVQVGPGAQGTPIDRAPQATGSQGAAASAVALAEHTASGTYGDPSAPKLYVFVDPMCSFSVRAMQQLKPLVDAKRLQVAVIPVAILDQEEGGRSVRASLAMLSVPPDRMVQAWAAGKLDGPAAPDAQAKLAGNRAASEQLGLRGTPTLVWRKADGSDGRADGLPADLNALAASMAR